MNELHETSESQNSFKLLKSNIFLCRENDICFQLVFHLVTDIFSLNGLGLFFCTLLFNHKMLTTTQLAAVISYYSFPHLHPVAVTFTVCWFMVLSLFLRTKHKLANKDRDTQKFSNSQTFHAFIQTNTQRLLIGLHLRLRYLFTTLLHTYKMYINTIKDLHFSFHIHGSLGFCSCMCLCKHLIYLVHDDLRQPPAPCLDSQELFILSEFVW